MGVQVLVWLAATSKGPGAGASLLVGNHWHLQAKGGLQNCTNVKMAPTSFYVHSGSPICLLPLQGQQAGLTQAPFKSLPL